MVVNRLHERSECMSMSYEHDIIPGPKLMILLCFIQRSDLTPGPCVPTGFKHICFVLIAGLISGPRHHYQSCQGS